MDVTSSGVTQQKFLVPLKKPVLLIRVSNKANETTTTIKNLIAHSSIQCHHLIKPTSISLALPNSWHLQ